MKIPFSPPYIDESVIAEVTDSLRSGWITTGPKVQALEEEIKRLSGAGEVLCVNSWTTGAIMTLRWLGVKADDEVIIPAYTYCATALAVLWAGAKPVMVDCGEDFNISVNAIRRAITPRTKVILPVDIAGWPCIMERMGCITVVNDSAHSIGSNYGGKRSGSQTDIAIFSLHAVKNITTAEGGAICLNMPEPFDNSELYRQLRLMSLNCQTKDAFTKTKAGGWRYDIVGMGMKANMADVNAAIGLAQIRQYDRLLTERRRVFDAYDKAFSQQSWAITPPTRDGRRETSYHVYALRIKDVTEDERDAIIAEISKRDIAVNVHFVPLPMLSFFHSLGYDINDYPQSYRNYAHEITLPCYPQLSDEAVKAVIDAVCDAYQIIKNN